MTAFYFYVKAFSALCFGHIYKKVPTFLVLTRKHKKVNEKLKRNLDNNSLMVKSTRKKTLDEKMIK